MFSEPLIKFLKNFENVKTPNCHAMLLTVKTLKSWGFSFFFLNVHVSKKWSAAESEIKTKLIIEVLLFSFLPKQSKC